jgi:hypothetical protein
LILVRPSVVVVVVEQARPWPSCTVLVALGRGITYIWVPARGREGPTPHGRSPPGTR